MLVFTLPQTKLFITYLYLYNVSGLRSNIECYQILKQITSNDSALMRFGGIHSLANQWQESFNDTKCRDWTINVIAKIPLVKSIIYSLDYLQRTKSFYLNSDEDIKLRDYSVGVTTKFPL